ncbi:hypothetical protein HETIRDRAFT_419560 [Heterobasidion irregulare TC 32-1]|uniref:DUF6589 domain-containing protein n=1 Tax=Heterobasidion irregulare (strain TC 32-1) TaxID=747525 RepID=W4K3K8_HETIT|nr:uncharacterized protein HETIRDRAFT_419560 [Heterobasidion irregulare TC 32-1]ETW79920.1 hypothetical protein HETIRDRAFT_419560 [Heterobasidion irregulare TC 32-1]
MAENNYEQWQGRTKVGKELRASKIALIVISMLLFGHNRSTNLFQVIFGMFLSSAGTGRRVLDVCNQMGLSMMQWCLQSLTHSAQANAVNFVHNSDRIFAIVYNNINFTLRKAGQWIDNTTKQLNATTSAILLQHAPGLRKSSGRRKHLMKKTHENEPQLRMLGAEKTVLFPLPALDEEEASVGGTIRVVIKLFTDLLRMAIEVIKTKLRLLVKDWLTIQNLRLMRDECSNEFNVFEKMDWVQEASMPFHFQLNAMYMLFCTHLGYPRDNGSSSLGHHQTLLCRSKLDPKKPEYNLARELVLVREFASTAAGHNALEKGDEVLAHSIFIIQDSLMFMEFGDAINQADFLYEYSAELCEIVEHTWLVNRWDV